MPLCSSILNCLLHDPASFCQTVAVIMESLKGVEAGQRLSENSSEFQKSSVAPAPRREKTIHCSSQLSEQKFSYTWIISDFDVIPFVCGYAIYSPPFLISKKTKCQWQISMSKHTYYSHKGRMADNDEGDTSGSEDELSETDDCQTGESEEKAKHERTKRIGFRLSKPVENHIWDAVRYSFTVKTSNGTTVSTPERVEPGHEDYSGVPRYAILTEKDFGEGKLFNEKYLEVTCDIGYSYVDGSSLETPVAYEGKILGGLRGLFNNEKFSDLVINAEGAEHHGHKVVLQAGVPGFEKLLKEDEDSSKTTFDLQVDSEVGKAMVNFIYCGKIVAGFPLEKCIDLHEVAKRYGVDCLEQYCSNYFKNNLAFDVCKDCLGICNEFEDCLRSVKKLGVEKVKRILSKEACSHVKQ